jgi:predicted CoA-substrate-specific enzyme activase
MLTLGMDIGSTTAKAALLDSSGRLLWQRYERHRTRQLEKVADFLEELSQRFSNPKISIFTTGSGGKRIARLFGARHFQEVNALSTAVERFHASAGSIFELGGQDAKYIAWRGENGKFVTMNDRCAGGTGATIDRIMLKLNLSPDVLRNISFDPKRIYPVAGKCGVFAETDINSLQKQGVQVDALLLSLFQAIVEQNLCVLARGYIPHPPVLLLGGPNVFFPALEETWRSRLMALWNERDIPFAMDDVSVPDYALLYGALGAALLGASLENEKHATSCKACKACNTCSELAERVRDYHGSTNREALLASGEPPFFQDREEREAFLQKYAQKPAQGGDRLEISSILVPADEPLDVYIGIDGGSTSTKGVVLDVHEQVIERAYRISDSNPVDDARQVLKELHRKTESRGIRLNVRGIGFTGYAKDLLNAVFNGDTAIVETVAHTLGALKYFPEADVICDVGGQDIKIILLKNGAIKDFRLNTQCSAGNGYYLQSTANRFGYTVEEYAEAAFRASAIPEFNFGCAVFLEADIVNFQQLGWKPEEIMAGLARILPQNVWLYVVREPNMARLGSHYVLQGGTHNNLAVVKAQYDYIKSRVKNARIYVHPYNEVAGAIGAGLEAMRSLSPDQADPHSGGSRFIGFDRIDRIQYQVEKSDQTRCRYCSNHCMRTIITVSVDSIQRRHIIANCEQGMELEVPAEERRREHLRAPNFVHISNVEMFRSFSPPLARNRTPLLIFGRDGVRGDSVIGIPRVLGIYSTAIFFRAYFEGLGVKAVRFSEYTTPDLYRKTAGRGSIDPCFPSKIAIAHVNDLLQDKTITHIFFPCIRMSRGEIHGAPYHWSCAALAATPEVVKAAFSLERNEFLDRGIRYLDPVYDIAEWDVFERQLLFSMKPVLHVTRQQNREAMETALRIWDRYLRDLQNRAAQVIHELEMKDGIGIVLLGRPYHNDPGVNHGILDALNRHGYPIFTLDSLPRSGDIVERIFGKEIEKGHPMDIRDVWVKCYSENTSLKVWAAKFVSRHPNLIALDLSSFRCGHDAPLYSLLDDIFSLSPSPYFTFHEIDENKPESSIKLRVETMHYFLQRQRGERLYTEGPQWQKSLSAV